MFLNHNSNCPLLSAMLVGANGSHGSATSGAPLVSHYHCTGNYNAFIGFGKLNTWKELPCLYSCLMIPILTYLLTYFRHLIHIKGVVLWETKQPHIKEIRKHYLLRVKRFTSICCGAELILSPYLSVANAVRLVWPMASPWTRKAAVYSSEASPRGLKCKKIH